MSFLSDTLTLKREKKENYSNRFSRSNLQKKQEKDTAREEFCQMEIKDRHNFVANLKRPSRAFF